MVSLFNLIQVGRFLNVNLQSVIVISKCLVGIEFFDVVQFCLLFEALFD